MDKCMGQYLENLREGIKKYEEELNIKRLKESENDGQDFWNKLLGGGDKD